MMNARLRLVRSGAHRLRSSVRIRAETSRLLTTPSAETTPASAAGLAPPRRLSQPTPFTHAWLLGPDEVTPGLSRSEYASRRQALQASLPAGTLALVPASPQQFMSGDVPYLYRGDATLRYLTGVLEPDALLAVWGGGDGGSMLFTIPRDPAAERWNGPRIGACDDVAKHFGLDVRPTSELPEFLEGVLPGMEAVVLPAERQGALRPALEGLPEPVRERFARLLRTDVAADAIAAPLRLRKSPAEIALMRRACSATANALNDAMSQLRANPGGSVPERAIESIIEYSCKRRGADRMAFPSVVAGGANGTVLHYMANSQRIPPGSLVMVDAGCELSGYSADVSRTWPVSGIFTPPQRDLYSLVLDVQKRLIANTVPGSSLDELHVQAATELAQGLLDLGFLKGETLESALASGKYAKYYPHATGHFLGMDVHDTHSVRKDVPLEVAMVVTIEPGLYVDPSDEGAPEEFRGIGIRIEDDVLVGASGSKAEVLSGEAFKEVRDIEELVGSARHKWNVE